QRVIDFIRNHPQIWGIAYEGDEAEAKTSNLLQGIDDFDITDANYLRWIDEFADYLAASIEKQLPPGIILKRQFSTRQFVLGQPIMELKMETDRKTFLEPNIYNSYNQYMVTDLEDLPVEELSRRVNQARENVQQQLLTHFSDLLQFPDFHEVPLP